MAQRVLSSVKNEKTGKKAAKTTARVKTKSGSETATRGKVGRPSNAEKAAVAAAAKRAEAKAMKAESLNAEESKAAEAKAQAAEAESKSVDVSGIAVLTEALRQMNEKIRENLESIRKAADTNTYFYVETTTETPVEADDRDADPDDEPQAEAPDEDRDDACDDSNKPCPRCHGCRGEILGRKCCDMYADCGAFAASRDDACPKACRCRDESCFDCRACEDESEELNEADADAALDKLKATAMRHELNAMLGDLERDDLDSAVSWISETVKKPDIVGLLKCPARVWNVAELGMVGVMLPFSDQVFMVPKDVFDRFFTGMYARSAE